MWRPCAAEWWPSSGQDWPLLPVRGDGRARPGAGAVGAAATRSGTLAPSAAAGGGGQPFTSKSSVCLVVQKT